MLDDRIRLIATADRIAAFLEDRPYRRRVSNQALIYQEVREVVELYFEKHKAEAVISTVMGAVSMERLTSLYNEQFSVPAVGAP